jgi:NAD(P)H-hydrate epimerase
MKIVTAAEMKQVESEAEKNGLPPSQLMENAGLAVAETVMRTTGAHDKKVLVLVGPGKNGGDGLITARHLSGWGVDVTAYLCSTRDEAESSGIKSIDARSDEDQHGLVSLLGGADVVVDAIFGTGQNRPIEGIFQKILLRLGEAKNAGRSLKIVAVDLPSGLDADIGKTDPVTPFADITVTLGPAKRGLYSPAGAERAGEIIVADIGIPARLTEGLRSGSLDADWARTVLPYRSPYGHKGSFGKVLVIAGSANYVGAACLACAGAMRVGAGLTSLAIPRSLQIAVASRLSEVTFFPLAESFPGNVLPDAFKTVLAASKDYEVVLSGCGLGNRPQTREFSLKIAFQLKPDKKIVFDADSLNHLSSYKEWWKRIPFDAVLTPHPGEMARLCGTEAGEVQANRFELALQKAAEWNKTIVLKGADTVIAAPDGRLRINISANAGMATAGTGDVLAGAISGLLAQGMNLFDAACLGTYLHSKAGERTALRLGDAGMIASDLLGELPLAIKGLKETPDRIKKC